MPTKKLNIGVIGLGWVATNRHIPVILKNNNLHLYGVVDGKADRIQRVIKKYPWVKSSLSRDGEMPWLDQIDAVLIATDPLNHFHLAKKMLLSGKNVLLEKPLAMSTAESLELQQISEKTGLICSVGHNFQFSRSAMKLRRMLSEGSLGEIQSIEAVQLSNPNRRLPVWFEQLPFGLYYDESPHMFYMLKYLSGHDLRYLESAVVRTSKQNTPTTVTALYDSNGVPIRLNMNFVASLSEWHITVIGTKGLGIIDLFRDILIVLPNDGSHRAREILASTGYFIALHLWGVFKSSILLVRKKLFYGADVVWDKFATSIQTHQSAASISVQEGSRVVELQHELMERSSIFELPTHEDTQSK